MLNERTGSREPLRGRVCLHKGSEGLLSEPESARDPSRGTDDVLCCWGGQSLHPGASSLPAGGKNPARSTRCLLGFNLFASGPVFFLFLFFCQVIVSL